MSSKILLVDDDPEIRSYLRMALEKEGFEVETLKDGKEVISTMRSFQPELIILDLILPDTNGFELCKKIRSDEDLFITPIIMLTGRTSVEDRVQGLNLGADSYFTKPFYAEEVIAQIKTTIKRSLDRSGSVKKDELLLRAQEQEVLYRGQRIENLTTREFGILYTLVKQSPRAVNRADLFNVLWKQDYPETTRRIDMMVKRLRTKIGEDLAKRIKTEGGIGYRFE
ncbi:MAG: response regulator transcription factor [bacterium]